MIRSGRSAASNLVAMASTDWRSATPAEAARPAWKGPGLLEGAAGIALAMEAAATTAEPVWDQMLLVSAAGTPGAQPR